MLKILVENSGWKFWLKIQVENSGWKFRLKIQVENSGWKIQVEKFKVRVEKSGLKSLAGKVRLYNSGFNLSEGEELDFSGKA
jgi:uncharacterized protein YjdB